MSGDDLATQQDVVEIFQDAGAEVGTVGGYVRVKGNEKRACFGPVSGQPDHGWSVVEISWEDRTFLLAPPKDHRHDLTGGEGE